jgi:hypothetical protein
LVMEQAEKNQSDGQNNEEESNEAAFSILFHGITLFLRRAQN